MSKSNFFTSSRGSPDTVAARQRATYGQSPNLTGLLTPLTRPAAGSTDGDRAALDALPSLGEALLAHDEGYASPGSLRTDDPSRTGADWTEAPEQLPHLHTSRIEAAEHDAADKGRWRPDMSREERIARRDWLAEEGRGRPGLRIMLVTENFLPKVDGVTRTLAKLLEHLEREGHECMVLGPETGMSHYASHPLVGTAGIPLVIYPGLKLNFLRPRFLSRIQDFQPDVVHFVDPVWLGGQTMKAMEMGWAGSAWDRRKGYEPIDELEGATVASYHTNLATYATLFGMPWLEPILWGWQKYLYSKALVTLCPSPSTASMLHAHSFKSVRMWPRGINLDQFTPRKRSAERRRSWGIVDAAPKATPVGLPDTPPATPDVPASIGAAASSAPPTSGGRLVAVYAGRVSWEKNLLLLLHALAALPAHLPANTKIPKMVFAGDGPARGDAERFCRERGIDALFLGHKGRDELAEVMASADVFLFPSFTETFGQVVLEALASGLPVIGLDADGTRDLVTREKTGLLLDFPHRQAGSRLLPRITSSDWPRICKFPNTNAYASLADDYARLVARVMKDDVMRAEMGRRACTEGIEGYTWWDAMERCVDGYREAMRMARTNQEERLSKPMYPDRRRPVISSFMQVVIGELVCDVRSDRVADSSHSHFGHSFAFEPVHPSQPD